MAEVDDRALVLALGQLTDTLRGCSFTGILRVAEVVEEVVAGRFEELVEGRFEELMGDDRHFF